MSLTCSVIPQPLSADGELFESGLAESLLPLKVSFSSFSGTSVALCMYNIVLCPIVSSSKLMPDEGTFYDTGISVSKS